MDVTVEIHCGACGSANFSLPGGSADDALVVCNDCRRTLGRVDGLKAELVARALALSAEALRDELDRTNPSGPSDGAAAS